jgi:hypothetical protein
MVALFVAGKIYATSNCIKLPALLMQFVHNRAIFSFSRLEVILPLTDKSGKMRTYWTLTLSSLGLLHFSMHSLKEKTPTIK